MKKIEELASLAEQARSGLDHSLIELLDRLQDLDPEIVDMMLRVFGDSTKAARWLANSVMSLGGVTPLRALAEGRREDVLRVLHQISYGIYG